MSTSIKLKVCGMRDPLNIQEVASLQPDFMGFIFYPKSPRYVGTTFVIPESLPAETKKVGVFVKASTEEILNLQEVHHFDYIQLHGGESVEQVKELKEKGLGVIKVFSVDDAFDITTTDPFVTYVDYFLFDTKGKHFGGNAVTFNWDVLKDYSHSVPFFLSGGLTPGNVADIQSLRHLPLAVLDINSGVEDAPAVKNIGRIKDIQQTIEKLKSL